MTFDNRFYSLEAECIDSRHDVLYECVSKIELSQEMFYKAGRDRSKAANGENQVRI